ncbi:MULTISPECIES: DHA2 family efflux MFS transporter permease subunit [Nocardioides]|uniref:DHA2 family efflux MFS transporter permease subunit n=1 Tax=Nocardioides vastitatis TaxID=2568655 RepID=A0ABW0ZDH6_9ACTN|nr:DHA2 family efflux MFS transporter permease subunit [Nocardioides sp.]THJ00236.1 DHA2 family efflux MFS transporter permease subunit [Nocardioides sp.]
MTATAPPVARTAPADPASRRATIVALTVVAGTVMIPLDVTVVAVALARLSQETGAALPVIQWVSTGYTLALAAVIPAAAWAMGRYGARTVFLGALLLFTVGSVLVACSWDAGSMIAFRVVQGMGGGFVMPAAMTLALHAAPVTERGRVMALLGLPVLVGPVLGPPLGGWVLDNLSWRWLFLINLPIGLVALWLARRNLPTVARADAARLDRRGLVLLAPAMVLLVMGASLAEESLVRAAVVVPVVASLALLALFVRHALRTPTPLLQVGLLSRRLTGGGALVLVLFAGAYFSTLLLVPLYFQVARGESASTAGLLMVPQAVLAGLSIQVAGRLVDRVAPLRVVATGISMAVLGYAGFALLLDATTSYWVLVPFLMLGTTGAGASMLPTMTLATRHLDHDEIPSGTTMINVLNQLATSVTTALVAVLLAAGLTSRLPALDGGVGGLQALTPDARDAAAPAIADAVRAALALPVGMMAAALVVAMLVLWRADRVREPAGR